MCRAIVNLIHLYQYLISPLSPPTCRFIPTCSNYACEVFVKYGVIKGGWLSFKRLLRCNPLGAGGYDPAP